MYERSYGSKYAAFFTNPDGSPRWRTAAEIAAAIRADIKAKVAEGVLPKVTYSVRSENFAGGRSINVVIKGLDEAWVPMDSPEASVSHNSYGHEGPVLSKEAARVRRAVEAIHGAYNYDGSEAMVDYYDVNYYGHVEVESEWARNWRLRQEAARAAKKGA